MSVVAQLSARIVATETFTLGQDVGGATRTTDIKHSMETEETLDANSSPAVTDAWSDRVTLSAGAATIDLTALDDGVLPDKDWSGKKIQAMQFKCPTENTSGVKIKFGVATPYHIFGGTVGEITVLPGSSIVIRNNETLPDISASLKHIDLSSSDQTADLDVILLAS